MIREVGERAIGRKLARSCEPREFSAARAWTSPVGLIGCGDLGPAASAQTMQPAPAARRHGCTELMGQ